MPSIQIKDVPPETHAVLRARAAAAGQSLQEYLWARLVQEAATPTMAEALQRVESTLAAEIPVAEVVSVIRVKRDRR
jgi:plasmid stability protein